MLSDRWILRCWHAARTVVDESQHSFIGPVRIVVDAPEPVVRRQPDEVESPSCNGVKDLLVRATWSRPLAVEPLQVEARSSHQEYLSVV